MDATRQLRLIYSLRDLQLALSSWTFFMEVSPDVPSSKVELRRFRCYQDYAVIAYWRPFSRANGLPAITFADIGVTPTVEELALHDRLRVYRNKVVAHSDPERMRILLASIAVSEDDKGLHMPIIRWDEGLELLEDRGSLEAWLHKLMSALSRRVFELVQNAPKPFHFLKDHLADDETSRTS